MQLIKLELQMMAKEELSKKEQDSLLRDVSDATSYYCTEKLKGKVVITGGVLKGSHLSVEELSKKIAKHMQGVAKFGEGSSCKGECATCNICTEEEETDGGKSKT